jgi:hypothetical protein
MAILLVSSSVASAQSATQPVSSEIRSPSDIRGVSWSDPKDNYKFDAILPAGLSHDDSPERTAEVAELMANRFKAIGVNCVRLGINPATVADEKWWPSYERAIRTLADQGLGVILCAWEQSPEVHTDNRKSHNGRYGQGDVNLYAEMWKTVHQRLGDHPNVIGYELLNEPFGFRGHVEQYVADMRQIMAAIGPELNGKRILIGGIGYSDNVQVLRDQFPEPHVWFAYHVYPNWFGGDGRDHAIPRESYAAGVARDLAGLESRAVITEFGCWGNDHYDYAKPADEQASLNANTHVAYLTGFADACEKLKIGSIYWTANAEAGPTHRSYDLLGKDGEVFDQDRMRVIRRAWRLAEK